MTQKELKKLLEYDKNTGIFRRKISNTNSAKIGDIAGTINLKSGYVRIGINGKVYTAHRLAWLYIYGEFPEHEIDHQNHDRSDNRIDNLRDVTRQENSKNLRMNKNNTSGVSGVFWSKKLKKWQVQITFNGIQKHLGFFTNINEAKKVREKAKVKYKFHLNHM